MKDLTRVVHHPMVSLKGFDTLTVPTYRASSIIFDDAQAYANRKHRGPDGYTYGLHGTPTTKTLEAQISALEHAERTVLLPSGQAAITIVFLAVLEPGDKVLIPDTVYPPVRIFCAQYLAARGIDHVVYDPLIGGDIAELIDDRTRLIWTESPGSTTMEFQDVPAIVAAAKARSVLTGCDNTWATPLLFKPLDHGVDFSMQALSKYVGGHSDILMGAVSVKDIDLYTRLKDTGRMIGMGVSPDDCSMVLRGIETIGVRLAHVGQVAEEFAGRIVDLPGVRQVLHPSLSDCPGHESWRRDFSGASGVFTIIITAEAEADLAKALGQLKTFAIGSSWGGTRSLIAPMSVEGDRTLRDSKSDMMLRVSIGLEHPDDLWADLAAIFDTFGSASASGASD
ncbi:putative cystathionine beta-lyase [uncultured Sphingopyxis sp.]|uniref:Putative cystathionine beta-lyase n=1 Tax=uncultured Sphingopyxis sp. TaxID=310581 RepID=A0A1Y5PT61_9SPHN|nr:aminotransferase class I/II-fold pyridoxal phosphate-dependent enzyme [uncultured Sphingopyxis sp.]SBV31825.1 putative cystathionine beta-lyase [uncultured Sphingopyxis sp.]